ncbi:MAG: ribosome-binding factor A, partial [Actinomycetes bacterium]
AVPENAAAIDDLLRQAAERDAEVARLAQSAQYAGEADPYRRPEDDVDAPDEPDSGPDEPGPA